MPKQVVLVAEDDPIVRLNAMIMLEDEGVEVIEAADADEAITL